MHPLKEDMESEGKSPTVGPTNCSEVSVIVL